MNWKLTVLTDRDGWLRDYLEPLLTAWREQGHDVGLIDDPRQLAPGDLLFLLGCSHVVSAAQRATQRHTLVVHESALPQGRGWSPLTWQVLAGVREIPITLFEASDAVDSGPIYAERWIELRGDELLDELRALQAAATLELCRAWLRDYPGSLRRARPQLGAASYYRRRVPDDSRLDLDQPLRALVPLLRVCDPQRYPAFFDLDGTRFYLTISKEPPCRAR